MVLSFLFNDTSLNQLVWTGYPYYQDSNPPSNLHRDMARKLPHYLRSERRRSGLSQEDIAALLDTRVRAISRYERHGRLPPLATALAYEAVFGVPVAELFSGAYRAVRESIQARARRRAEKLGPARTETHRTRRKESLQSIALNQ